MAEYDHVKWSRVVSMESREQEAVKVWDLGPDIAAEFLLLHGLDDEGLDRIPPLFDPEAFK